MANRGPIAGGLFVDPRFAGVVKSEDDSAFDFEYNIASGGVETVDSGGSADVLEAGWLADSFINLDPGGGSITLTTDTAANIVAGALANATAVTVHLRNAADAAETITIAGGSGVTVRTHEGAADLVIGQDETATLTFVKVSASAVECYMTIFV